MWIIQSTVLSLGILLTAPLWGLGTVRAPLVGGNQEVFRELTKEVPDVYFEPRFLRIDKIGLSAAVVPVGITAQGFLESPTAADSVGWYYGSARLGEPGNTILVGHRDSPGGQPAAFFSLGQLTKGDVITIRSIKDYQYRVVSKEIIAEQDPRRWQVLSATPEATTTLITCEGHWQPDKGSYDSRLVVKLVLLKDDNQSH